MRQFGAKRSVTFPFVGVDAGVDSPQEVVAVERNATGVGDVTNQSAPVPSPLGEHAGTNESDALSVEDKFLGFVNRQKCLLLKRMEVWLDRNHDISYLTPV